MSRYWQYDPPSYSYGGYTALPPMSYSPAFQWGYAAAANQATRMPRRHRRALSLPPEGPTQLDYSTYSRYAYPGAARGTAEIIKRRMERMEDDEPLVPPVSFGSLRQRLLVANDLCDSSKRMYERYIPGVDDVTLPSYKRVI